MEHQNPSRRERDPSRVGNDDREVLILGGINRAIAERCDIDPMTARLIAHCLAPDKDSALTRYAYTGEGSNQDLRAEYLPIYQHEQTSAEVRELIDWLGTLLVHHDNADDIQVV